MRGLPFSYQNSYYDSDWTSNGVNYLKTIVSGLGTEIVYEIPSPAQ
jgi:hypothetical protein